MSLVLVVDDNIDLLNLYTDLLEEMGHQVVSALDGVDALRLAIEQKPELIITDWRMPRMDGMELCKALKHSSLVGRTRIILHSSESIPEPWYADVCLRKPSSLEAFETVVKALLASPRDRAGFSARRRSVHESVHESGVPAM